MIVPATLAGITAPLPRPASAIWRWGCGRRWAPAARTGPLVGGMLLEHFYWGSVFLINVPIVLVVIAINAKVVPRQPARRDQPLNLLQALILIAAILMLVFSAKSALKGQLALWLTALVAIGGAAMLLVYPQTAVGGPADGGYATVHSSHYFKRGDDGDDRPDYPGGFELLMAQELQFVHQKNVRGGDVYAAGDGGQRL